MAKHNLTGKMVGGDFGLVKLDDQALCLQDSLKILSHSPDGFAWGYGGSGPSQLALAVLLKLFGKDTALKNYQNFKWDIIANLDIDTDFNINFDDSKYCTNKYPEE